MEDFRKINFNIINDESGSERFYNLRLADKEFTFGTKNKEEQMKVLQMIFMGITMELSKGYFQFVMNQVDKDIKSEIIEKGNVLMLNLNGFITKMYNLEFKDKEKAKEKK